MKEAFKKNCYSWRSLKIFGLPQKKGWCKHYISLARDYCVFKERGFWVIMRRDTKMFLDGRESEYLVTVVA